MMRDLAANGYAILFYSTDLAELANVADRTLVLSLRAVSTVLAGADVTEDRILARHDGRRRSRCGRTRWLDRVNRILGALGRAPAWAPPLVVLVADARRHRAHAAGLARR